MCALCHTYMTLSPALCRTSLQAALCLCLPQTPFPIEICDQQPPFQRLHKYCSKPFRSCSRHVNTSACHRQHMHHLRSPTLLPSALQDLLKGISTRADVHVGNWAFHLADKLRRAWFPLAGSPPFAAHRGEEALEYAALPTLDR